MKMGGGGGGGGPYYNVSPEDLKGRVKEATEEITRKFGPEVQQFLDEKLRKYNNRNSELIQKRQDAILKYIEDLLDASWDLKLGGSVAKHTYVDGLSDVDSLLIIHGVTTDEEPKIILDAVSRRLDDELDDVQIEVGRISITVSYADDMQLQFIPAVRDGEKVRVPSWTRDGWSRIDPKAFTDALTRRNQQCEGKLVPTIKLAKAIIANWPSSVQLSGYHVESLAIDAFREYKGPHNTTSMLPHLFERAASTVLAPIRDRTGQSIHVDEYLGKTKSPERQKASHWCSQVAKRMKNASTQDSLDQWRGLFDE
jgi:hypothetical protein